jgi:predicted Fe-Mo cluster-binding NifX family protein
MNLMISSQGETLESQANPKFGRTPFFIKYDLEDQSWNAYPNAAINQRGGAGVAASQFIIDQGAVVAISGRFGPNAYSALKSAGIKLMTFDGFDLTISDVINAYTNNQLKEIK